MSKSDTELINKAENTDDFCALCDLEMLAVSSVAKSVIHSLAVRAYHLEEYSVYGEM